MERTTGCDNCNTLIRRPPPGRSARPPLLCRDCAALCGETGCAPVALFDIRREMEAARDRRRDHLIMAARGE